MLSISKSSGEIAGEKDLMRPTSPTDLETNGNTEGIGDNLKEGGVKSWCSWIPTSSAILSAVEKRILSYVKTPFTGQYVNIGPTVGNKDNEIWTLSNTENGADKTPLVLVHGFASGAGLWALNLDEFAADRPVYVVDLLGFARSSRPTFSSHPEDAEKQLAESIEEWRKKMNLEQFVLVGHSMGGFISSSYAIRYPNRVSHLVLADPWGYTEKPADLSEKYPLRWWVKMIAYVIQPLGINPLSAVRAAGPWGPKLIENVRTDLNDKFSALSETGDNVNISEYIYHCNAQKPTGEAAFHAMMNNFGWAKRPMINRIHELSEDVPVTFLYGSKSWIEKCDREMLESKRPNSYLDIQILQDAGHHVYADSRQEFNASVLKAAAFSDNQKGLEIDMG